MSISRRQFVQLMGIAGAASFISNPSFARKQEFNDIYNIPKFGDATIMHFTDVHGQLNPIYFREPNVNIGVGGAKGHAPHLVGNNLLKHFNIKPNSIEAHAFTYLNYTKNAQTFGKIGGFAHLSTLINKIRSSVGGAENTCLLDGGDTWQGSGTSLWTNGEDMVDACNLLGVDAMTGHWEFTHQDTQVLSNIKKFKGEFLAQNVRVKEEALFDDAPAYDADNAMAFKPWTIKKVGGHRIAIIGQAFPYTPIANPQRFIPNWSFGIMDDEMQKTVDKIRSTEKPDAVVVLSHNGMDVDLKMASKVTGIDVIFGGHTHDGVPQPIKIKNKSGITLVTNAGSNGKFLGVMALKIKNKKVVDFKYNLLPVFSNLLPADKKMQDYIDNVRRPYLKKLNQPLAVADNLLYRRGNFNGTFDQIICNAMNDVKDSQISLSPGFRWGTTVLPGQTITMENVLDQTCITYPETYRRQMSGKDIKIILEDVADNLFNPDPYYQQGGDMVRVGGLDYAISPNKKIGSRISSMTLDNGKKIDPNKKYIVSGWATVGSKSPGEPIWDVVAEHLSKNKTAKIPKINTPKITGLGKNPGLGS
ncbi:MAG: thiosulfohydrolase SoxB [Gammaproteobacteria bacterium]|nr:MAG: thiosulfohydrolase SoxB [Gammaproteobacteria bacterium]